jgi:hypothetical protein
MIISPGVEQLATVGDQWEVLEVLIKLASIWYLFGTW